MADYYSILKRTIASLPESNGAARRSVYSRARNAIVNQLKAYEPPLSPSEITAEQLRLEEAIRKVEAEAARQSLGLEPLASRSPEPSAAPVQRPAEPVVASASATVTEAAPAPVAAPEARYPASDGPKRDYQVTAGPALDQYDTPSSAKASGPLEAGSSQSVGGGPAPRYSEDDHETDAEDYESNYSSDPSELDGDQLFEDDEEQDQDTTVAPEAREPSRPDRPKHSASDALRQSEGKNRLVPIVAAAAAVVVVVAGAYFFLMPDFGDGTQDETTAPVSQDLQTATATAPEATSEPQSQQQDTGASASSAEAGKNTDRLLNETDTDVVAPDARTVTTTTINPQADIPDSAIQPSIVTNVGSSSPAEPPVTQGETGAETEALVPQNSLAAVTPSQPEPAASGTSPDTGVQRSILYEEGADTNSAGTAAQGAVTWTVGEETDLGGQAQQVLSAMVEIPERDVKVDIRIKPNDDTSLPASHLVEIKYELPDGFSSGDIVNVPGLVMKPTEEARGDALIGASVKVSPGFFWIALSSLPNEQQRNMALLRERGWIDIPMLYENGKRGILTLEKGSAGAEAVEKAVAAWQAG